MHSNPQGWIYDLDAPRMYRYGAGVLEIQRVRANFETYVQVGVPESAAESADPVRASAITPFYVRMSIQQQDSPSGTNWTRIDDIDGDNYADYDAQTPLTYDLQ